MNFIKMRSKFFIQPLLIITIIMFMLLTGVAYAGTTPVAYNNDITSKTSLVIESVTLKAKVDSLEKQNKNLKTKIKQDKEPNKDSKKSKSTKVKKSSWKSLGDCRVTEYCPACNDPAGSHESKTGVYLTDGHAACNWLPMGTVLQIDGRTYEVVDTCGTDAIDLFVDDNSGVCYCDMNTYKSVKVKQRQ